MTERSDLYRAIPPSVWPTAPTRWSNSTLAEIEECPRRWALEHASYSNLPGADLYPRKPALGTVTGQVVHASLEVIAGAFHDAVCGTASDRVDVLRTLGGITNVVEIQIAKALAIQDANPRMQGRSAEMESLLTRQLPDLRQIVQLALSQVSAATGLDPVTEPRALENGTDQPGPLTMGFHSEVRLAPATYPWVGYADAMLLTDSACEILDYKTGSPSPHHAAQLRTYAWLWSCDRVLNPRARLATRLALIYPGRVEEVEAPSRTEIDQLQVELLARTQAAGDAFRMVPPPPRVSPETCRYCEVKQLCDAYWSEDGMARLRTSPEPEIRSVGVQVVDKRGDGIWAVVVTSDPYLKPGTHAIATVGRQIGLHAGVRARLIDVRVAKEPESGATVFHLGRGSEVFILD